MPEKLVQTLQDLKTFMMGNWVSRQNELALLDMTLYTSSIPNSVEELDQKILEIVNQYSIFPRGRNTRCIVRFCIFSEVAMKRSIIPICGQSFWRLMCFKLSKKAEFLTQKLDLPTKRKS